MVCFGDVGWCERGMCPGVGLASFGHLHLDEDVVRLPKLALEAALSCSQRYALAGRATNNLVI